MSQCPACHRATDLSVYCIVMLYRRRWLPNAPPGSRRNTGIPSSQKTGFRWAKLFRVFKTFSSSHKATPVSRTPLSVRALSSRAKRTTTLSKLDPLSSWSGVCCSGPLERAGLSSWNWSGDWNHDQCSNLQSRVCAMQNRLNVGRPQLSFHSADLTLVSYTVQDCNNNNSNNKLHPPLTTPLNTISPLLPDSFSSGYWPPS